MQSLLLINRGTILIKMLKAQSAQETLFPRLNYVRAPKWARRLHFGLECALKQYTQKCQNGLL